MPLRSTFTRFFAMEAASGLLLIAAAILALVINNSPLSWLYNGLLETPVVAQVGALKIAKPLLLWINDGLMALFFLLIGLEVLFYWFLNRDNPPALNGWAIPTATDIAFALGVLALLGKRVPTSLKLFLMTLAIIDDLGAIVIIAIFYSGTLSTLSLMLAAACIAALVAMNRLGVVKLGPYMIIGLILWVCVLKSGVHATLAGVTLAFCIPLRTRNAEPSPLQTLEHALHPWVSFGILPLFAFANAGLSLSGVTVESFTHAVPMGIAIGLLLGKTVGVFGLTWLAVKTGLAALPSGANWGQVFGVAILCGIGFTMSLFVGSLAFVPGSSEYAGMDRMGILTGSLFAALIGYAVTAAASRKRTSLVT
ncbi:sodium:proton antiporter [Pseudomonas sp. ABAC61]|nr:sodium:proton antiporter [Pseudomonas sp. ABAC61]